MEITAGDRCVRVSRMQGLHQSNFEIAFDDARSEQWKNRSDLQHDSFVEAVMLRGHANMQDWDGHSFVRDHDVEELHEWSGRSLESCITQKVLVVLANCLQDVRTSKDDSIVLCAIVFCEVDSPLTSGLELF